ncbi:MAG: shikimate dehydrogenase [Anaerolineales bacterium]|nr:shikimate dehydrogenase [Anaerolineales bacterium]
MMLPPTRPTFYFAGVTTAKSSSRRMFPRWMEILGRPEVVLEGIDFAIHDHPTRYRAFVEMLRDHPLALGAVVTTHKIDLLAAARDLFAELDPAAQALGEVSGIGKTGATFLALPRIRLPGHEPWRDDWPRLFDQLMAALPGGSIVINATGMGKDSPGSPITDAGRFPITGVAWELNYRGELEFLHQAERQQEVRRLHIEDGWRYFLLGWSQVISRALAIDIPPATFEQLAAAAADLRF